MNDIVERLRLYARHFEDLHAPQNVTIAMREAADKINRLRAALRDIRDMGPMTVDDQRWRIAKNALEAGDETIP